ncbi:hypothetical protein [Nocardioides okcheonensis]|uniref:hypothetical protein n=1 Tax=Nocardioides okcheonensis TaxID=2894081 RepID=UPI001E5C55A0|nr:hypothetical protein [Nocardioides okcheonensis]UFN44517.1 hypothetical protein LN652_21150 [Nocardioides okcheonensis]
MIDLEFINRLRMENLPGFAARVERRDRVVAELGRRRAAQTEANPLGRFASAERFVLEEMLEAGDPLEELDQRIAVRVAAAQSAAAALRELIAMRGLLDDEVAAAGRDTHHMLPMLHSALRQRVEEAEALGPIDQIATDEATKTSRRYADRDRLGDLLDELGSIRFEQGRVLREAGHELGGKTAILHMIRNVEDVFPRRGWLPWLTPGWLGKRGTNGEERVEVQTPWPRPLMAASTTPEFGLWALQAGAEQWVPTLAQQEKAAADLTRKSREPRQDDGRFGEWFDPGPSQRYQRPTDITGGSLRR